MKITRRIEFSSSHVCAIPGRSLEENRALYGAASNPQGHGHNYVLEVTIAGEPDPVTGMIVDLKAVKEILNQEVVGPFDHRHLNYEVPAFGQVVPTTENIALEIWRRLVPHFTGTKGRLDLVKLYETEDLYVEYAGEPA